MRRKKLLRQVAAAAVALSMAVSLSAPAFAAVVTFDLSNGGLVITAKDDGITVEQDDGTSSTIGKDDEIEITGTYSSPNGAALTAEENQQEENQREPKQPQPVIADQQRFHAYGEGGGGAPGDGKAGADGQIQQHGEKTAVALTHLPGKLGQALAAAQAHGCHTQQRKTYAGNNKAHRGYYIVPSGSLSHMYGENQIAGSEEEAEEQTCYGQGFLWGQFPFHSNVFLS